MNFKAFFRYIMAAVAIVLYNTTVVSAANVSKDDLKKVEEKVLQQTIEHKKRERILYVFLSLIMRIM